MTLPVPTSLSQSSSATVRSSVNPLDIEPYISTVETVVSGTTQLVPMLFGGMFTTPVPVPTTAPLTSLTVTGSVASSSASALSSQINIDLLPLLSAWTDTPQKSQADNAVSKVKGIIPFAENLLASLGGDPTGGKATVQAKREGFQILSKLLVTLSRLSLVRSIL